MAETLKLAVPTMGKPGLRAQRSAHFGHCDCFTLIDIVDGKLGAVSSINNPPHEEGGCIAIVDLLKNAGVASYCRWWHGYATSTRFCSGKYRSIF